MEQLQELERKVTSARELHNLVKSMKAIASVNIREHEQALRSLNDYSRTVELGLQVVMGSRDERARLTPGRPPAAPSGRLGAVVIGSELGLVGPFNDEIAGFALERMDGRGFAREDRRVLAVGERVVGALEDKGQPVQDAVVLRSSLAELPQSIFRILTTIEDWRERGEIDELAVFNQRPEEGRTTSSPVMTALLPLNIGWLESLARRPWPTRVLPMFTMDRDRLFASLIRNYFFVSLFKAIVESLAAENAGRLASLQVAEKNIGDRLDELTNQYRQQRQSAITAEMLDIISGAEALSE